MVSQNIMRLAELERLHFGLLDTRCIDQFTAAVIAWYQEEIITNPHGFWGSGITSVPPNVFHLFEYPNIYSDIVFNQFIKSVELRMRKDEEYTGFEIMEAPGLEVIAAKVFQEHFIDLYEKMLNDVMLILNKYSLSFCYKDDASVNEIFYNLPIRGVW